MALRGRNKTQELQRNFKLVTMFGFSAILMCSWESLLSGLSIALANGGTAGLIWTWFVVWIGFTAVYLSMAEMGSMAPTTGGMLDLKQRQKTGLLTAVDQQDSIIGFPSSR